MKKIIPKILFTAIIIFGLSIGTHNILAAGTTTLEVSDITVTTNDPVSVNATMTLTFKQTGATGLVPKTELGTVKIYAKKYFTGSVPAEFILSNSSTQFKYNVPTPYSVNLSPLERDSSYTIWVTKNGSAVKSSQEFKIDNMLQPTVTFDPITLTKDGTDTYITTTVTYKTKPGTESVMTGKNVTDAKINLSVSSRSIVYDKTINLTSIPKFFTPRKITVKVPGLSPGINYSAVFSEQSYDKQGDRMSFTTDNLPGGNTTSQDGTQSAPNDLLFQFVDIAIANGSLTTKGVSVNANVIAQDLRLVTGDVITKSVNLVGKIVRVSTGQTICTQPFSSTGLKHNVKFALNFGCQELSENTKYDAIFTETLTNTSSTPLTFTTKSSAVNPTTQNSSPSNTGQVQNNTASGLLRFSGISTSYPGTKIAGAITPTLNGNNLIIDGELTYSKIPNKAAAVITRSGMMSFSLIDGDNGTPQTITTQLVPGIPLEYDNPYHFQVTFPNYNRYLNSSGNPINQSIRPTPFLFQIKETQLSINSEYLTIITQQNSNNTNNTNNTVSNTATTSGLDGGGRSISVMFNFSSATIDENTKTITINGDLTYDRDLTDAEIQYKTVNKIFAYVYNSTGTVLTSSSGTVTKVSNKKLNFSKVFSGIDITKVDKFIIKDTDFSIASDLFSFNRTNAGGSTNLSSAYSAVPATKNGTTVNLTDPEIVTALSTSTSVNVKGTATYSNNSKTGTVSVADNKIILNLYTVDNQNSLTFNNSVPVPVTTANYNQPVNFSVNVITSDQTKKYAVQFVESNYNNAKSSAKVIEYKDGKFAAALNQPANNQNNNNGNNPPAGSTGGRGVLKPYLKPGLDTIPGIVTVLVDDIVIPIAVPLLAIAIMYTGFLFVRARGNSTKLEEAKRALKWTLLGGAIILGAYVIATALQATISDIVK